MLSFRARIQHFTWANFAFTIAGGGTASMLKLMPYRFKGLTVIGDVVFLFNFTMLCLLSFCMITRFVLYPDRIKRSLTHSIESMFFPTYLLSWATVIMDIELYGRDHTGAWRVTLLRVMYWIYVAVSTVQATCQYSYYILSRKISLERISPSLLLIIFPLMLSGCTASNLVGNQPHRNAMQMIISGTTFQLMGLNVSLIIYGLLVFKFLTVGAPPADSRPGVFIMVGPMAFTGLSLIDLGKNAAKEFPKGYISTKVDTGGVFAMIGIYQGLLCWATSLWFFAVGVVIVLHGAFFESMRFKMAWCAMVFPSAGMTMLTFRLGEILESSPLQWVGCIMGACVSAVYLFCIFSYFKAIALEEIMAPGQDEDALIEDKVGKDCASEEDP